MKNYKTIKFIEELPGIKEIIELVNEFTTINYE